MGAHHHIFELFAPRAFLAFHPFGRWRIKGEDQDNGAFARHTANGHGDVEAPVRHIVKGKGDGSFLLEACGITKSVHLWRIGSLRDLFLEFLDHPVDQVRAHYRIRG